MGLMTPSRISRPSSEESASCARSDSESRTQNEIVYSDEDCVMSRIEIDARETAANILLAIPVLPLMPVPLTLIMAVFFRHEMPHTSPTFFSLSNGPRPMRVPRASGLWLLRLHASIFFAARGSSVLG